MNVRSSMVDGQIVSERLDDKALEEQRVAVRQLRDRLIEANASLWDAFVRARPQAVANSLVPYPSPPQT
jgi:hypothetical protein